MESKGLIVSTAEFELKFKTSTVEIEIKLTASPVESERMITKYSGD